MNGLIIVGKGAFVVNILKSMAKNLGDMPISELIKEKAEAQAEQSA